MWTAEQDTERIPVLPLAFGSDRYAVSSALKGWDRGPGVRFGEGIEQWHFVATNQTSPVKGEAFSAPARRSSGSGRA